MAEKKREYEMKIDIEAPPEEVWRALTEAQELVRWFPLQAKVEPRQGGAMHWSWGKSWTWETRIEAWEPPRLLRLVQEDSRPYDADGKPLPAGQAAPARLVVEFALESRAGKTSLRLVHSGFGRGARWDEEFDGIQMGWQFELRSLKQYLQRHRGRDRHVGWAHLTTPLAHEEAWAKLLSAEAFPFERGALEAGREYAIQAATGDRFSGTIGLHIPERELYGTVRELDGGILRLYTHRTGSRTIVSAWLATYAASGAGSAGAAAVEKFQGRAQTLLERLFAAR